jgi:hypothetical protein
MSVIPQKYKNQYIDLGGWDTAYALGFTELNAAIKFGGQVPNIIDFQDMIVVTDEDTGNQNFRHLKFTGNYEDWQVVGALQSGDFVNVFVKLCQLSFEYQKTTLVANNELFDYQKGGRKFKKTADAPNVQQYKNDMGVLLSIKLIWKETQPGKYSLTTSSDAADIVTEQYFSHPDETFNINAASTKATSIQNYLSESIGKNIVNAFNHVFALIDYTQIVEEKAKWLALTSHKSQITLSNNNKKLDFIGKIADNPDFMSDEEQKAYNILCEERYNRAMDTINNYNDGFLCIVGMTDKQRKVPENIPSSFNGLIATGNMAGFAYNDNLIIQNLVLGHLYTMIDCAAIDFKDATGTGKTIENSNALTMRNDTTLDYNTGLLQQPNVRGTIVPHGLKISIEGGMINFAIQIEYTVAAALLGLGLPQDMTVLQSYAMSYDYGIGLEDNTEKFARISLAVPPEINANVYPKSKDTGSIDWVSIAKDFGTTLVTNVILMALTFGAMRAGAGVLRGVRTGIGKISTISKEASAMEGAEGIKDVVIDEAEVVKFNKDNATTLSEIKAEEGVISKDTALKLDRIKAGDPVKLSATPSSFLGQLIVFTIIQTALSKGLQIIQQTRLSALNNDANHDIFYDFIGVGMASIQWGGQSQNKIFTIKDGGLAQGCFVLGLDLEFAHNTQPNP